MFEADNELPWMEAFQMVPDSWGMWCPPLLCDKKYVECRFYFDRWDNIGFENKLFIKSSYECIYENVKRILKVVIKYYNSFLYTCEQVISHHQISNE